MNPRRRTMNFNGAGEGPSGIPAPPGLRPPRASMAPTTMLSQGAPPSILNTARKVDGVGLLGVGTPARGMFGGNPPPSQLRSNNPARFGIQTPGTNRGNRRTSVFQSTRRSTIIAAPTTIMRNGSGVRDPRPLKNRAFQSKAQQTILDYLSTHAYPGLLTPKTLVTPTVKDFQAIFKFLYMKLDPKYMYGAKFEDDALQILRGVKYPYVGNISKSQLFSAGSMSAWPSLMAMLLWLVELIESVELMAQQEESKMDDETGESSQFVDRVFFDYLAQAYPVWLDSGDEPPELEQSLAAQFEQKNEHLTQAAKDIEGQLEIARAELKALKENESPLRQLERSRVSMIKDKSKFEQLTRKLERKNQQMMDSVTRNTEKLEAAQVEKLGLEKEIAEVKVIVDAQQISTEDVDRMTAERNQLQEVLDGVQEKLKEATDDFNDKGMRLQRVLDTVDEHVLEYAAKAQGLGFIGGSRKRGDEDPLGGAEIELTVDKSANDKHNVASVDLRGTVRPALQRACDVLTSQWHATETEVIKLREKRDQLADSRMELEVRVEEMDKQVSRHNAEYLELRETIMLETQTSTKQIELLEASILGMQRDMSKGQLQSEAAVRHAETERNSVLLGCRMRRNEIDEDVVATLEGVAQMKRHTQEKLRELLQLVAETQEESEQ
ncbi:kinetochore-associated Ndc80 complex subunit ndc80 [Linderina macrospora]|uniref:Kinetochore-associated Ndc80 complex subunit ndc80 n=1 Tax=Linderina macrospora TaxID=4868 RepID=A0ACC1JF36_9FUNG|nr:kinetochore-associated Ndc80 complex subunit ndc80 [Linderina macrospora]